MAGSLRERRKQLLREEILAAAQVLIAEKGYGAMSMDELAAQVGISKPTLYLHFANKDALVMEAIKDEMRVLVALIEEQAAGRSPLDLLAFVLRAILERQLRAHTLGMGPWPEVFRLMCEDEGALGFMQRIDRDIVAQVRLGIERGEIAASLDPAAIVGSFYGMLAALPRSRLSALPLTDPERTAEGLVEIFLRGVRA